jgi:hypothetical protein
MTGRLCGAARPWKTAVTEASLASDSINIRRAPQCGGKRSLSTFYGMPTDHVNVPPWLHTGGCYVSDQEWFCSVCDHEWLEQTMLLSDRTYG